MFISNDSGREVLKFFRRSTQDGCPSEQSIPESSPLKKRSLTLQKREKLIRRKVRITTLRLETGVEEGTCLN